MDQVERLMERPMLYNNVDGVGELGMGFMFLSYALFEWFQINSPANAIWHRTGVFVVYVGLMATAIHYGSKAIKTHITYPRTGYVEYRKRPRKHSMNWGGMAIGAGVGVLCCAGIALVHWPHWSVTTLAALIGLVIAAYYAYRFARSVRWKWAVASAMALCSLAITLLPADLVGAKGWSTLFPDNFEWAWLLSTLLYGTILLISGGISFVLYLRHTQPAAETAE